MKIKISKDLTISELPGKIILFHNSNDVSNKIFELEATAVTIWNIISTEEITLENLHKKLAERYDSYSLKDQKDTERFLEDLRANKIIQ